MERKSKRNTNTKKRVSAKHHSGGLAVLQTYYIAIVDTYC